MRIALLLAPILGLAAIPAAADSREAVTGATSHSIEHGGLMRTYRLYVPKSLPAGPVPLVVLLHGGFGTGPGAARQGRWDEAARRERFVTVAPDGISRAWNAGGCCGPPMRRGIDDVGFVLAVLDDVARQVIIDQNRVYATGISNGGMMTYRLACEASDRFAAMAPVSSTLMLTGCAPARPLSLLHVHGLADRNVPFDGGAPTKSFQRNPPDYPPVRDGIAVFTAKDGCSAKPAVTHDGKVTTERWRGCDAGTAVELITISDGGHSWPGGRRMAKILYPPSDALDATAVIWKFFAAHPRHD